jgi:hypothetical protein
MAKRDSNLVLFFSSKPNFFNSWDRIRQTFAYGSNAQTNFEKGSGEENSFGQNEVDVETIPSN